MSRRKNSINNLIWGIIGTVVTSIVAMIIPRLFIVNYGSEVNGLLSSIRQIYAYLALLEVGIGDASVVALYGPIGTRDFSASNRILSATNKYYKKIGAIYALSVLAVGCVYPLLLDTSIPFTTCFLVIVLQGSGSVIGYLVQGKYNMLLRVDNRNYVTTNLTTVTAVLTDITRIILLMNGRSIVAIQTTYLIFNLIKMAFVSLYIKKNYKWLDLSVEPDYKAIAQKGSVFMHQISSLVFGHTDVLVLTFVCGLKTVSIYTMYASLYAIVNNIISIISNSIQSALGQIFHINRERYKQLNNMFETYYLAVVFALFAIASIFILPFMKLYTEGADINYIDWRLPVLFGVYQLLNYGRVISNYAIAYAGEFKATQWRAWLETVINLVVSFVCVFKFGIYGVLIGTIAALLYRANDIIFFSNHRVLKQSVWPTYRRWLVNSIIFASVVALFISLPLRLDSYVRIIMHATWVGIITVGIFILVNSIIEVQARRVAFEFVKDFVGSFKHKYSKGK